MTETIEFFRRAYAAFNRRDVDGVLEFMTPDVRWPKSSEGGSAVGKDEIRAYWKRQWQDFDPSVEPLETTEQEDGTVHVRVHQIVRNTQGDLLSDSEFVQVLTIRDGRIAAMGLGQKDGVPTGPSAAFAPNPEGK
jgi:ketosteroid isomerase-like protein